MTLYENIVCENPGNEMTVRDLQIKDADPADLPSILKIRIDEVTLDVTCDCSGTTMKRADKKFPLIESEYHCNICGKNVTVVWD